MTDDRSDLTITLPPPVEEIPPEFPEGVEEVQEVEEPKRDLRELPEKLREKMKE